VSKVLHATWQRCRVHFMRNTLAHAGRPGCRAVSVFIGTALARDDAGAAKPQWGKVADQLRPKLPTLVIPQRRRDERSSCEYSCEYS
jgi:transposase-like protein